MNTYYDSVGYGWLERSPGDFTIVGSPIMLNLVQAFCSGYETAREDYHATK